MESYLPIPAAESELKGTSLALATAIQNHADNFYHSNHFNGDVAPLLNAIVASGYGEEADVQGKLSPNDLLKLLLAPSSRLAAVQHFIAEVLLASITLESAVERALLPKQVVSFYHAAPMPENLPGSNKEFREAFKKWRHLSAYLLTPYRSNREPLPVDQRALEPAIKTNISLIQNVVHQFLLPEDEVSFYQEQNLAGLVFEGAKLGTLIFCQPKSWIFEWRRGKRNSLNDGPQSRSGREDQRAAGGVRERYLVVFPGLGEETLRGGKLRARIILEETVVEI